MNILDYLDWRGDLTLEESPFNGLDALIISQLSLITFDETLIKDHVRVNMTIEDAANLINEHNTLKNYNLGMIIPDAIIPLFLKMGKVPRFKKMIIGNYINDICITEQIQFSALTVDLDSKTRCISFSGTDDTIIGWKENFNMLCVNATPGQKASCQYLEDMSIDFDKIIICGHSKGGNLAIYSALHSRPELQEKIVHVFDFDGPGLTEDIKKIENAEQILKKSTLVIPQTSIIGCLFEHYEPTTVVHSNAKGLYQHDVFSWEVCGKEFVIEPSGRTKESLHIERKIKTIIKEMSDDEKHQFVDIGYRILSDSSAKTLTELNRYRMKIVKDYLGADYKSRKMLSQIFLQLLADKIIRETMFNNVLEFTKIQKKRK